MRASFILFIGIHAIAANVIAANAIEVQLDPSIGYRHLPHYYADEASTASIHRNASGRIKRSSSARKQFMKLYPCPSTDKGSGSCPGFVVDHILALKRGGIDAPSNMQWQTTEEAKKKDKWE